MQALQQLRICESPPGQLAAPPAPTAALSLPAAAHSPTAAHSKAAAVSPVADRTRRGRPRTGAAAILAAGGPPGHGVPHSTGHRSRHRQSPCRYHRSRTGWLGPSSILLGGGRRSGAPRRRHRPGMWGPNQLPRWRSRAAAPAGAARDCALSVGVQCCARNS